jgi:hypothetical protein
MNNKWNHTFAVEVKTVELDGKKVSKRTIIFKDNETQESEIVFEDYDSNDLPIENKETPRLNSFIRNVIQRHLVKKITKRDEMGQSSILS